MFEINWAYAVKYPDGFTIVFPSVNIVTCYISGAIILAMMLKDLLLRTAYAMWTRFEIVGAPVLGFYSFMKWSL